jgi:predicted metal-dependent hydrolase
MAYLFKYIKRGALRLYNMEISGVVIEVHNKRVRTLRLVIYPGAGMAVRVSAPLHIPQETIKKFVESKMPWIKKHLAKYAGQRPYVRKLYNDGENHQFFGREYSLRVMDTAGRAGVALRKDGILELKGPAAMSRKDRAGIIDNWYRKSLKEKCPEYILKWEKITGLKVNGWGIKAMKTRWGTCNTRTARIWLNLELVKWPEEWLDYVVLHEILHLKERNHGKGFKALLDRYMPGWKKIKLQLSAIPIWREDFF